LVAAPTKLELPGWFGDLIIRKGSFSHDRFYSRPIKKQRGKNVFLVFLLRIGEGIKKSRLSAA
jgi:hypothetical protein